jgi:3-oxoacyl-[acyl-carrier protein] reductase
MKTPQTFFLTGCASGIGRHLADKLIAQGHCVFATDINFDALAEHAQKQGWPEEQVRLRRLDVRDHEAWDQAVEEAVEAFGDLDVVMNIAGYMLAGWIHEASPEDVDRHFDINTKGVIYGTQAAARRMLEQGHGQIINIASISALAPIPGISLYCAAKYAVRAFSLAAAQELRPHNVYVTVICPDAVRTPLLEPQQGLEAALVFSTPKLFSVEDIARVILEKALPRQPLEIVIPAHRGWLAHLTNMFPQLAFALGPFFRKRGEARQADFFARRDSNQRRERSRR